MTEVAEKVTKEEKRKPFFVAEEVTETPEQPKQESKQEPSREEEVAKAVPEIIGSSVVTPVEKEERPVSVHMKEHEGENIMWEEPKKSTKKPWIIVFIIILILVIGGGAYFFMKKGTKNMLPSFAPTPTVVPTATPVQPTPTPTIDLTKYTVSVLNGSGVVGAASKTKDALTTAGFTVKTTGNASTSDYTTTVVSIKSSVGSAFVQKLIDTLKQTYAVDATIKTLDDSSDTDITVTIGTQTAQ